MNRQTTPVRIVKFPVKTDTIQLVDHCKTEHVDACEVLVNMSEKRMMELSQQLI